MPSFIAGEDETVEAKKRILDECGIAVSETPSEVGSTLVDRL
jgi:succinyl-CoA synthetase alpha subunit